MCNPADDEPCISGTPSEAAIQGDARSAGPAQPRRPDRRCPRPAGLRRPRSTQRPTRQHHRHHDAAGNGTGAGKALTGGGTLLPMSDVIRLARHAHHYLAIFDKGKALALYHTKRLASPAQRIVLYAKDRGCSSGLPRARLPLRGPPPHPYANCHTTDVNDLTLACSPTTRSPTKAGPPAQTPTATPNGSHHHTSTTATPRKHLPPPRKTAAGRRRRRGALTISATSNGPAGA